MMLVYGRTGAENLRPCAIVWISNVHHRCSSYRLGHLELLGGRGACQRWSLVGGLHATVGIHLDGVVGTQLPPPSLWVPEWWRKKFAPPHAPGPSQIPKVIWYPERMPKSNQSAWLWCVAIFKEVGEIKPFLIISGLLQTCWYGGKVVIPYVAVKKESVKEWTAVGEWGGEFLKETWHTESNVSNAGKYCSHAIHCDCEFSPKTWNTETSLELHVGQWAS